MKKDLIEKYLKNIEEELDMYADSLSENKMPYIDMLVDRYNKWESMKYGKDKDRTMPTVNITRYNKEKSEQHEIVDSLMDAIDEFNSYMDYKKEYMEDKDKDKLTMAHQELGHFLTNLYDVFKELDEYSKDIIEERAMIKSKVKEYYQLFG